MSLIIKLIAVGGDTSFGEVEVVLPAVVGRSTQTDVRLPHPLVSRKHCELVEIDGKLTVRDLGSLNGTLVKGQRITQDTTVLPEELLTIGPVVFRASYEIGARSTMKPPVRPDVLNERIDSRQTARVRETTIADDDRTPPPGSIDGSTHSTE